MNAHAIVAAILIWAVIAALFIGFVAGAGSASKRDRDE